MNTDTKYTYQEAHDYFDRWLLYGPKTDKLSLNNIAAGLSNAYVQIECDQDGLEVFTKHDNPEVRCYAIFHGEGGYPEQNKLANETFRVGGQYVITDGSMSQSSTRITIEGVTGEWNSVLFHYDDTIAPIKNPYISEHRPFPLDD